MQRRGVVCTCGGTRLPLHERENVKKPDSEKDDGDAADCFDCKKCAPPRTSGIRKPIESGTPDELHSGFLCDRETHLCFARDGRGDGRTRNQIRGGHLVLKRCVAPRESGFSGWMRVPFVKLRGSSQGRKGRRSACSAHLCLVPIQSGDERPTRTTDCRHFQNARLGYTGI